MDFIPHIGSLTGSGSGMADSATTQTNKVEPWGPQQDHLKYLWDTGRSMTQDGVGFNPYQGPTQAVLDPYTKQSQNMVANLATSPNQMVDGAGNNVSYYASGGEMAGGMPDYLKSMLDYNASAIGGQTAGMASGAGRYGSNAHANTTAQGIANANNPYIFGWANQAANRSLQAGAMVPMMNEMKYDGATRLAGLGDYMMGREQQRLDTGRQLWEQGQQAPWSRLNAYNQTISGNVGSTSQGTSTKPGMTGMQGMLGGAMTGASMGSLFGPVGTAAGGILGAVGGGMMGSW